MNDKLVDNIMYKIEVFLKKKQKYNENMIEKDETEKRSGDIL